MKRLVDRARLLAEARAFFASRGYLEVETPIAVPSPGLDAHLDAFELAPTAREKRFLATSPEYQMKRLLADGHERIFQITRAFRAGELGERHNPEFTILEFYRASAGIEAVMRDTEQLVARLTAGRVRAPATRMTVSEAFARFAGVDESAMLRLAHEDEDVFFEKLAFVVEPALARIDGGVFLVDWPLPQASLARKKPSDPRFAERFELYVGGVELCNGFGELTDAAEQRARFAQDRETRAKKSKPVYPIDERFLDALARGLPDCAGNAIGFDRLVALACGAPMKDVMAFTDDEL